MCCGKSAATLNTRKFPKCAVSWFVEKKFCLKIQFLVFDSLQLVYRSTHFDPSWHMFLFAMVFILQSCLLLSSVNLLPSSNVFESVRKAKRNKVFFKLSFSKRIPFHECEGKPIVDILILNLFWERQRIINNWTSEVIDFIVILRASQRLNNPIIYKLNWKYQYWTAVLWEFVIVKWKDCSF